jgi:NAD(P)-dependent dehydrogenase (short-subunit alcohol dehydrogenase family)
MRARDGIPTNQFHRLEQSLSGDAPYGQDRCVTTRKTALVTGAGAGREYVRLLLLEGSTVLAVSLLDDELGERAFTDPVRVHTSMNPAFFDRSAVEDAVAEYLQRRLSGAPAHQASDC